MKKQYIEKDGVRYDRDRFEPGQIVRSEDANRLTTEILESVVKYFKRVLAEDPRCPAVNLNELIEIFEEEVEKRQARDLAEAYPEVEVYQTRLAEIEAAA
jgi:hypothetical protein